jgi:Flp pilus assembly protein TadG
MTDANRLVLALETQMQLKTVLKSEDGSVFVLTAIGMVVIIGFAGLAIDVGNLRMSKRHLQSAADAAALAAALEVYSCKGTANCSAMQAATKTSFAENGFTSLTLNSNCTGSAGSGVTITVDNPPCAQGAGDPNSGKSGYVEVLASRTVQTYFVRALGFNNVPISARAEAKSTPNPNCVYSLDTSGGNAITVDLLASITSACGIVDESSAWNALSCNLIASITAPQIDVVGGVEGFLCLPSTTPKTGVPMPVPADPLSGLPKPTVPACGTSAGSPFHGSSSPVTILGAATLYPDNAYCGGITILPTANVTFMPGTYVLKSGGLLGLQGGLTISLLANVAGTGVTFYNLGPLGGITMLAPAVTLGGVSLVAPTSGTYACILFFQDPQNTTGATIVGSADWNTVLEGAYYFPNANVLFAASLPVHYNTLVAKDIEFLALSFGKSSFSNDYSTISNGCPIAGGGSVLVQ